MSAPEPLISALADRYEIDREIGAGGMANVYLARDVRHHRRVALKVLKPELGAVLGPERFLSEIRVTANLQHPNLLPLFDSGEAGGLLYYVMPFIDGESLRARLDREKQLPVDEAVRLATSIASALDYAHRHGVIHRDLKPENVLLQEGQPLVTDFGIALAVSNAGGGRITQTGLSLGTPQYMSPEQATGDRSIDGRTDIYSLGAILYEMLAGDPPYHASTSQAIIAKVITENVPDVRVARPSVPENVALAIGGALEKLPADRWSTAAEFSDALQGKSVIRRAATTRSTIVDYAPVGPSRNKALAIAAGLLAAGIIIGVAGWALTHRAPTPPVMRFEVRLPANAVLASAFGPTLALTPDGQSLIYVGRGASTTALYRRKMSDLVPTAISGTDTAVIPELSPDGKWLAFLTNATVKKVPVDGGVSTPIARIRPEGFSWGKGDVIVLGSSSSYSGLQTVSARGGDPKPLTVVDSAHGEVGHRWPVVVDDGNTVLYASWRGDNATARIGVASIKTGKSKTLDLAGTFPFGYVDGEAVFARADGAIVSVPVDLKRGEVTGDPLILASGVLVGARGPAKAALTKSGTLIYAAGSPGTRLMLTDSIGRAISTVVELGALSLLSQPRISPDGRKLAVALQGGGNSDIWVYDLSDKTRFRLTATDSLSEGIPNWSPDGRRVMYMTALKSGGSTLSSQTADGSSPPEVLVRFSPQQGRGLCTLTPDGRAVVCRIGGRGVTNAQLWLHSLVGDTTSRLLVNVGGGGQSPSISPDGKWLAYSSDESGTEEVYVTTFPTPGARWPISSGGGTAPEWAKNGKSIYYASGVTLTRADLNTQHGLSVLSRTPMFSGSPSLGRQTREYDLMPDGKHFLFGAPLDTTNTVIAVLNWRTDLRKKAGARAGTDQ
jgi:Tol biopolymer transport system component/tRNA A-37 threonylcarbamoyl transferase component Bud32